MQLNRPTPGHVRGLSLIELMVAVVIGLIVLGGLTSIVVATIRTNTDNARMTRLTQEMRGSMQLITTDLRRAGFSRDALADVATGATTNPFITIDYDDGDADGFDDDNCILYAFDSGLSGGSTVNGALETAEQYGVRHNADDLQLEYKNGSASGCADDADWEPMTDPGLVEITALTFGDVDADGVFPCVGITGGGNITVREIQVTLTGRLTDDTAVTRTIQDTVRVRNDRFQNVACP